MNIRTLPTALVVAALLAPLAGRAEAPASVSGYAPAGWEVDDAPVQARGLPKNRAKPSDADDRPDQPKKPTKQQLRRQNVARAEEMAESLNEDTLGSVLRIEQTYAKVLAARQKAGQEAGDDVVDEEVRVRENLRKRLRPRVEAENLTGEERERELDTRVEAELGRMRLEAQKVMQASKNQNPTELQTLKLMNTSMEQNVSWSQLQRMAAARKAGREEAITQKGREGAPTLKIKRKPMDQDATAGDGAPASAPAPEAAPKKRSKSPVHVAKLKAQRDRQRLATGSDYDAQISQLERQAQALNLRAAKAKLQRVPAAPVRQEAEAAEPSDAQ